jgi:hypothetical protein
MGYWDIGFIDHFNTQLVITLNYSAIADIHTLQITRAHILVFLVCTLSTSRFLVTTSNSRDFSTTVLKSSLNGSSLPTASSSLQLSVLQSQSQSQSHFKLADHQSIHLGAKPLEIHDQRFFFQLNLAVIVLM